MDQRVEPSDYKFFLFFLTLIAWNLHNTICFLCKGENTAYVFVVPI